MADVLNINLSVSHTYGAGGSNCGEQSAVATENARTFFRLDQAKTVLTNLSKQALNIGVSHIGFYSGNTVLQQQVQHTLSVATQAAGVALAFMANPVLGAIGLVSTTVTNVDNYLKYQKALDRQNYQAEQLARRAGYSSNQNR